LRFKTDMSNKSMNKAVRIEILGGQVKILHHTVDRIENSLGREGWQMKGGRSVRHRPKKPRA
jgi:hypothetical protein